MLSLSQKKYGIEDSNFRKIVIIIFYSFIYAIGFQLFIVPSGILSTGFSGISQIIEHIFSGVEFLNYSIIYFIINIPVIIIAFIYLGKRFSIYTIFSVVTVSLMTALLRNVEVSFTNDIMLNSIFGGIVLGFAIGGLLKNGTSSGGTDIIGLTLMKVKNKDFYKINQIVNMSIVIFSMFYMGTEIGLYTLVSLYVRNLTINFVFTNNQVFTIFIICENIDQINNFIKTKLKRGVTILDAHGGYTYKDNVVILSVLNRYEYAKLKDYITFNVDDPVFISVMNTKEVSGNFKKEK